MTHTDITQQQRQKEELGRLATLDSLTGALNHGTFMKHAEKALEQCQLHQQPFALLMIDADHFKKVNDLYGHAAGDEVLKKLVEVMSESLSDKHLIGPLGGEEFAIFLPNVDSSSAQILANDLRQQIKDLIFQSRDKAFYITVSIGMTAPLILDISLEKILMQADKYLYQAKNTGRDRLCHDQEVIENHQY